MKKSDITIYHFDYVQIEDLKNALTEQNLNISSIKRDGNISYFSGPEVVDILIEIIPVATEVILNSTLYPLFFEKIIKPLFYSPFEFQTSQKTFRCDFELPNKRHIKIEMNGDYTTHELDQLLTKSFDKIIEYNNYESFKNTDIVHSSLRGEQEIILQANNDKTDFEVQSKKETKKKYEQMLKDLKDMSDRLPN